MSRGTKETFGAFQDRRARELGRMINSSTACCRQRAWRREREERCPLCGGKLQPAEVRS